MSIFLFISLLFWNFSWYVVVRDTVTVLPFVKDKYHLRDSLTCEKVVPCRSLLWQGALCTIEERAAPRRPGAAPCKPARSGSPASRGHKGSDVRLACKSEIRSPILAHFPGFKLRKSSWTCHSVCLPCLALFCAHACFINYLAQIYKNVPWDWRCWWLVMPEIPLACGQGLNEGKKRTLPASSLQVNFETYDHNSV